jgi:hypothetical protein
MGTYTKINKDILRKTILEDIDLNSLKLELENIDKQLKLLEKQPKTIVVFDDSLQFQIETLGERKKEISKLLNIQ